MCLNSACRQKRLKTLSAFETTRQLKILRKLYFENPKEPNEILKNPKEPYGNLVGSKGIYAL